MLQAIRYIFKLIDFYEALELNKNNLNKFWGYFGFGDFLRTYTGFQNSI